MPRNTWIAGGAIATAVIATTIVICSGAAQAAPAKAADSAPAACRSDDVSVFVGGQSAGAGSRHFDLTLVSRNGTPCTMPSQPAIILTQPPGATTTVTVTTGGDSTPIIVDAAHQYHTTAAYAAVTPAGTDVPVSTLKVDMPNDPAQPYYPGELMLWPGGSTGGSVYFSAWTPGVGLDPSQSDAG